MGSQAQWFVLLINPLRRKVLQKKPTKYKPLVEESLELWENAIILSEEKQFDVAALMEKQRRRALNRQFYESPKVYLPLRHVRSER